MTIEQTGAERIKAIKLRMYRTSYLTDDDYEADERELGAAFLSARSDIEYLLAEIDRLQRSETAHE